MAPSSCSSFHLPPLVTGAACLEWGWEHSVLVACGSGDSRAGNERAMETSERPMSISQATGAGRLSERYLQIHTNWSLWREAYQSRANFSQFVFHHAPILHNFLSPITPSSRADRYNKRPAGAVLRNAVSNSCTGKFSELYRGEAVLSVC